MRSKYVLCRPDGGLNDTLTQIAFVHSYARRANRIAVIDTAYERSFHFHDKFSNYFSSKDPSLVLDCDAIKDLLDTMSVEPAELRGRLNSYTPQWSDLVKDFIDSETGVRIWFDVTKDYGEDIVVRHACGGNESALMALRALVLNDHLVEILEQRINAIGRPFSALHIRNTDYRTDYQQAIDQLKGSILFPVFVATDSAKCREHCRNIFGDNNVISFARLPGEEIPIHSSRDFLTAFERNSDSILDLIVLALSNEYYKVPLRNGSAIAYSNYSILAELLMRNSQVLISLLGQSTSAKSVIEKVVTWQSVG